jgi:hypothetical protein
MHMNPQKLLVSHASSHRVLCSVLLLLGVAGPGLKAQDEEALKKRFMDEAPRSWDAFNSHVFELQGGHRVVHKKQGKETSRKTWKVKEKPGCRLAESEETDLENQTTDYRLYASNPDYIFSLRRKSADSPWVLTDVTRKQPGVEFRLPQNEYQYEIGSSVQSVLTVAGLSQLADLVRQPSFHVTHAALVRQEGTELVQIEFDNRHPVSRGPFEPVQSGIVLLDPERSWCVRGYEIHAEYSNSASVCRSDVIEMRDSSVPHFPLPTHIANTITSQATEPGYVGQTIISSMDARYDLEEPHPSPDSDFRLPAFGLPEPREASRAWWSLWAVGASLACIAAAGLWWWFRRRRVPKSAA